MSERAAALPPRPPPYRILSLDGGGVKGLATLKLLRRLEQEVRRLTGRSDYELAHSVQLLAGTSVGGVLAIALASGVTLTTLCARFEQPATLRALFDESCWDRVVGPLQWRPKYDGVGKRHLLQSLLGLDTVFGERGSTAAAAGVESPGTLRPPPPPLLLVPIFDVGAGAVRLVTSDQCRRWRERPLAWQVADATSAAPVYFPSVRLPLGDDHVPTDSESMSVAYGWCEPTTTTAAAADSAPPPLHRAITIRESLPPTATPGVDETTVAAQGDHPRGGWLGRGASTPPDRERHWRTAIDGGMEINNPSVAALLLSQQRLRRQHRAHPELPRPHLRLLSIGCGRSTSLLSSGRSPDLTQHWGGLQWVTSGCLLQALLGDTGTHELCRLMLTTDDDTDDDDDQAPTDPAQPPQHRCRRRRRPTYVRINAELAAYGVADALDDTSDANLAALARLADDQWHLHRRELLAFVDVVDPSDAAHPAFVGRP